MGPLKRLTGLILGALLRYVGWTQASFAVERWADVESVKVGGTSSDE
jgi:hypothetical protein